MILQPTDYDVDRLRDTIGLLTGINFSRYNIELIFHTLPHSMKIKIITGSFNYELEDCVYNHLESLMDNPDSVRFEDEYGNAQCTYVINPLYVLMHYNNLKPISNEELLNYIMKDTRGTQHPKIINDIIADISKMETVV